MNRPLLLGHRGARGGKYRVCENTIAAFDLALQHGCDGFEFDVRLTADGGGVICHDARFGNLSIAKTVLTKIRNLPALEEVLERYADRAFLDIELKVPGLEARVVSALSTYPPRRGYVISSFLPEVLLEVRKHSNSLPLGIICETRSQLARWPGLEVQYVIARSSLVTQGLVERVRAARRNLFCWTVNTKKAMLRMAQLGVDGIISDRPDRLVQALHT